MIASGAKVVVDGNAPPGTVSVDNPLVQRLRAAGDLRIGPKQAWTPVAEFATEGVDAVNFGPGDPRYAHRDDERVDVGALLTCYRVIRAFLGLETMGTRRTGGPSNRDPPRSEAPADRAMPFRGARSAQAGKPWKPVGR